MKIALLGYGKMGKTIERIAQERGHAVVLRVTSASRPELTAEMLRGADVAIEFTRPEAAASNVHLCLEAGVPVVSGTTGWGDALEGLKKQALDTGGALLHASNFSVGVQLFFALNRKLAELMNRRPEYEVRMEEVHHTEKKDAPSGTAITLAEGIIAALDRKQGWALGDTADATCIGITAHRVDAVPGTHRVGYYSPIDAIEIVHTAHSRDGFATGAVLAAEFLAGKTGVYSMQDVLGL